MRATSAPAVAPRPAPASAPARAAPAARTTPATGNGALLHEPLPKVPLRSVSQPQPSLQEVEEAEAAADAATKSVAQRIAAAAEGNGALSEDKEAKRKKRIAQAYQRALRLCAFFPGKELNALKWLEDFEDDPEVKPELPDYLAALHACEASGQPLERVWTLLMDLRKKGLDLDSSNDRDRQEIHMLQQKLEKYEHSAEKNGEDPQELRRQLHHAEEAAAAVAFLTSKDAWHLLERHAQRWLTSEAPHPRALEAVLRLGSLLTRRGIADVDAIVRRRAVAPILDAFQNAPERLALVKGLGVFTGEALRSLGIRTVGENGSESAWRLEAAKTVHRQAMLRRWTSWNEPEGPGSFAWVAYDLSSQSERFRCDGEVVGQAPKSPVLEELFPSLDPDQRSTHAEVRALMVLAEKLLQGFSEGNCLEIRGVLMLYTPFPPETASIYAMQQFLQLFPWVEMHVAFDDAVDLSGATLPVERIRCENKELSKNSENKALNGTHVNGTKS